MNRENGFSDYQPPYDRMYYRVLITFEGGKYTYSESLRPEPDTESGTAYSIRYRWQYVPPTESEVPLNIDTAISIIPIPAKEIPTVSVPSPPPPAVPAAPVKQNAPDITKELPKEAAYPSQRIYVSKENSVILNLTDADIKKYAVKFFDETGKEIINLGKIQEDFLILEKVNFIHSGWFYFELKEGNNLIEKNKIFISKDVKPGENGRNGKN
jgi:hypothetical protein